MGILTDDMQRAVREQRLGYVATVCADGTPNLSPKATTTVWDDDHLIFADIRSPQTIANLRTNPNVEVNVVDPVIRKGYRFKGVATVLTEGPIFEEAIRRYEASGLDGSTMRAVVLIAVRRALPLTSPAYDQGQTEEELRASFRAYYGPIWFGAVPAEARR